MLKKTVVFDPISRYLKIKEFPKYKMSPEGIIVNARTLAVVQENDRGCVKLYQGSKQRTMSTEGLYRATFPWRK